MKMISKFKNNKNGTIIEWDSDKGTLLTTVWEPVIENTFTINTTPETVEAIVATLEAAAAAPVVEPEAVEEELEQVQEFSSLAKLIENADPAFDAITKAGVRYKHDADKNKWVKA
jgi:hypothetical protein